MPLTYILAAIVAVLTLYTLYLHRELRRLRTLLDTLLSPRREALTRDRRLRRRYIVFSLITEAGYPDKKSLESALRRSFARYFGEAELVKADPQLIYYDEKLGRGVIRVAHTHVDKMLAAIGLTKNIAGIKTLILTLKTTGTLKRAKKTMYEK